MPKRDAEIAVVAEEAKKNDGYIRYADAKRTLLGTPGLVSNPKHIGFSMSRVLDSGRFERVSRGLYRLVEEAPTGRGDQSQS